MISKPYVSEQHFSNFLVGFIRLRIFVGFCFGAQVARRRFHQIPFLHAGNQSLSASFALSAKASCEVKKGLTKKATVKVLHRIDFIFIPQEMRSGIDLLL